LKKAGNGKRRGEAEGFSLGCYLARSARAERGQSGRDPATELDYAPIPLAFFIFKD